MPTYPALRSQLVGTAAVKIGGYDVLEDGASLVGLTVCNVLATDITVTVHTQLASTVTHLVKDHLLSPGATLILDSSVNLSSGEAVYVTSSDPVSADVHMSLVGH